VTGLTSRLGCRLAWDSLSVTEDSKLLVIAGDPSQTDDGARKKLLCRDAILKLLVENVLVVSGVVATQMWNS